MLSQNTKDSGFDSESGTNGNIEDIRMDDIETVNDPLMTSKCNGHHTLDIPDGNDWSDYDGERIRVCFRNNEIYFQNIFFFSRINISLYICNHKKK